MFNKSILFVMIIGLFLVGGCAKKADPNYAAALAHAKEMSKEENRSVKTFEISGTNITMSGVTGIIVREPMPTVNVQRPATALDVVDHAIEPLTRLGGVALGIWGATQIADTIADASETVVVTNQEVVTVEVPGATEIIEVPGETMLVNVPGETVFVDNPVVIDPVIIDREVPTPWNFPPEPVTTPPVP